MSEFSSATFLASACLAAVTEAEFFSISAIVRAPVVLFLRPFSTGAAICFVPVIVKASSAALMPRLIAITPYSPSS